MEVRLVPLSIDHVDHVMKWVNNPQVTGYFANRQTPISEEDERNYLTMLLASPNDRAYSIFTELGAYVGQCSLNQIYWPARLARVFMAIVPQFQERGFGKAALRQLLDLAGRELNLHKVWAIVREENKRSRALLKGAGFQFEGLLEDEYCVDGTYYNMLRFAVIL